MPLRRQRRRRRRFPWKLLEHERGSAQQRRLRILHQRQRTPPTPIAAANQATLPGAEGLAANRRARRARCASLAGVQTMRNTSPDRSPTLFSLLAVLPLAGSGCACVERTSSACCVCEAGAEFDGITFARARGRSAPPREATAASARLRLHIGTHLAKLSIRDLRHRPRQTGVSPLEGRIRHHDVLDAFAPRWIHIWVGSRGGATARAP